jgi:hypothetical protein
MNMSKELRKEWLPKLQERHARRHREGKSRMLDEWCEDYKYETEQAIKLLSGALPPGPGQAPPGPERRYEGIEPVVRQIWLSAEQPCGKRLGPILRQWMPFYERRFGRLRPAQRQLVERVSAAALDRMLEPARAQYSGRGRGGTKPGSLLRSEIPIRTGTWDLTRPGYLEADSVAHCGGSLAVDFTRSRPYHSDDNAHVEQKNWTWARQLLGYGRLENPEMVGAISALYREVWAPWQNFFLACLKLEQKWRVGSHWRKRCESPRTAYQRLCAPGMLTPQQTRPLRERHESLDGVFFP